MVTVADLLIRESLRPKTLMPRYTKRPMQDLRGAVLAARKFVLDDRMSEFLADISQTPFAATSVRRDSVLDTMRHGAMLPHSKTWIEYSGRAFKKRMLQITDSQSRDAWGTTNTDINSVPSRWGWLLEHHPQVPTVVQMSMFIESEPGDTEIVALPFTSVWNCADQPIPMRNVNQIGGMLAHGIVSYVCDYIGNILEYPLEEKHAVPIHIKGTRSDDETIVLKNRVHVLEAEMGGLVRYAMAFLSTLNDIPVVSHDVKPQRGFIARGQYRKFVEHKVLTLNVPQKQDTRFLARRLFVLASRRRRHEVRGHWRQYLRTPGMLCNLGTHKWSEVDQSGRAHCLECSAFRKWIKEYSRGDASKGIVTRDYTVTHDPVV